MTTNCWSRKLALQSWINSSSFVRAAISRSSETPLGLRGLRVIGASDCNLLLLISFSVCSRGYDIVGCPWYGSCCDLVTTLGGPWFCIFTVPWLNLSSVFFSVLCLRISSCVPVSGPSSLSLLLFYSLLLYFVLEPSLLGLPLAPPLFFRSPFLPSTLLRSFLLLYFLSISSPNYYSYLSRGSIKR